MPAGPRASTNDRFLRACRLRARRPHAGLVHAPGRPLPARVPRAARGPGHPGDVPDARAGGRDHAAAAAADAAGRGDPVLRHHGAGRRAGRRRADRGRRRAGRRRAAAGRCGRRSAPAPLEPEARAVRAGGDPAAAQGADRPADRVRRRAVHAGVLPDRRGPVAEPRADEGADARRAGGVVGADGGARGPRRSRTCGRRSRPARRRSRCSTRGPARSTRRTTSGTCCRRCATCSTACPTWACRGSTSAWGPASCCR